MYYDLSILLLKDIGDVSSFLFLWIGLLWIFCEYFCKHLLLLVLGKYIVELLDKRV